MSRARRVVFLTLALIIFFGMISGFLGYRLLLKTLPKTSGEIQLHGLREEVRICFDSYHVPHIFAKNDADLYFAIGFLHAQERLWQMDLYRRVSTGSLAEILGERALHFDQLMRTMGIARLAQDVKENISPRSSFLIESYARGVNNFLEQSDVHLPIEFTMLNFKPAKWEVQHSIAIQRFLALSLEMGCFVDPAFAILQSKIDHEKLVEILPENYENVVANLKFAGNRFLTPLAKILSLQNELNQLLGISIMGTGSNAWVVSGKKTKSGKPLLANDPHLWLLNPSIWYEVHFHTPDLDCAGFSIPGLPGIVIGQNKSIAWGVTNLMADGCDLFLEKIHTLDFSKYLFQNHWQKVKTFIDTIKVRGKAPVVHVTRWTRHGPIISDVDTSLQKLKYAIALKWVGMSKSDEFLAFDRIMRAGNWDEFVAGLEKYGVPPQNFVYADTGGNIGYYAAGMIPLRNRGRGVLPRPGWDPRFEWKGVIPFEQLPHWLNPGSGLIVTANNKMIDKNYPFFISDYWEPNYRFQRIWSLLSKRDSLDVEDFKHIQFDYQDLHADYILPHIFPVLEKFNRQDSLRSYFYWNLKNWDGKATAESVGAAIFEVFLSYFYENIFIDEMGANLYKKFVQLPNIPIRAVDKLIQHEKSYWFDDVRTDSVFENKDEIILRSLNQAFQFLRKNLTNNVRMWRWGNLHQLHLNHVLGRKKPLNSFLNIREFAMGGTNTTVNSGVFSLAEKDFSMVVGSSMRQIIDFADFHASYHILPTGQSGNPLSKHYGDQTNLWRNGLYRRVSLDSAKVEKFATDILLLKPAN